MKKLNEELNIYPKETELIRKIAIEKNIPTLLVGEAGLGKSMTATYAVQDLEYTSINLSKQHDLVDLIGQYVLEKEIDKDGNQITSFIFKHGKITDAAETGKKLILEELTMAEPTVLSAIHGLIETPPKLHTIRGDVEIHEDFGVIGTANPSWTNYQGVTDLNYAFEDRWASVLFGFPSMDKIEMFLEPHVEAMAKQDIMVEDLYDAAAKLFELYPNKITYYMSLRGIKFFAVFLEDYDIMTSLEMSFLNKVEPDQRKEIKDIIDNFIPLT